MRSFRFSYCLVYDRLDIATIYFFQFYRLILLHNRLIWLCLNLVTRSFRFDRLDLDWLLLGTLDMTTIYFFNSIV